MKGGYAKFGIIIMDKIYDTIIIGGGPAGLTSAIYAGRSKLSVLVIEKENHGSLLMSHKIENYPGFPDIISGKELYDLMKKQVSKYDVTFVTGTFLGIETDENYNLIKTDVKNFKGTTTIIATGTPKNNKKFPGEKEFLGKGVSYCATCDGAFTKNYISSVIGKGEEIGEEALFLTKYSKHINIFVTEEYNKKYDEIFQFLTEKENVTIYYNCSLIEISGNEFVENIKIKIDNEIKDFHTDFTFLYLGTKSNSELYSGVVSFDEKGYIIADDNMKSKTDTIFIAGDIRSKNVRQITTATSDGTIAGLEVIKYILKNKNNH